jgi:hypothetical protein
VPTDSIIIALMIEAESTSETSVSDNEAARRYMPEGYHIHSRRLENLISYTVNSVVFCGIMVRLRCFPNNDVL